MTRTAQGRRLTSSAALGLVTAGIAAAEEIGARMFFAICDAGGNLQAYHRMDEAPLLSGRIAQDKAFTAVGFGRPTHEWYDAIKDDPALSLGLVQTPRFVILGGGYPIREAGDLLGGIGVSGGETAEDMHCARAALEACGFAVPESAHIGRPADGETGG